MRNAWLSCALVGGLAALAACAAGDRAQPRLVTATAAPAWGVPFGGETWRRHVGEIDVTGAVERVRHRLIDGVDGDVREDGRALHVGALALQTAAVELDGRTVYDGDLRSWVAVGNTAQAELADGVIEHHESLDEGVAITWVLRAPTNGDWSVELATSGLREAGRTTRGVHFADAAGVARVRIGAATLVDAHERRWPIDVETVAGGLRWQVPAAVLHSATFPVALDPVVSEEIGTDAPVASNGYNAQGDPAVASNGSQFVVAWIDFREDEAIYATRMAADGTVLDPYGFEISETQSVLYAPAVASDGIGFEVAWATSTDGVLATSVGVDGTIGAPVSVSSGGGWVAIASNSDEYLIVCSGASAITARRVSHAGVVLDSADRVVSPGTGFGAEVASNGSDFLVAWTDRRNTSYDIYATRVDDDGTIVDGNGFAVSAATSDQEDVAVSSDGNDYLVAWTDDRNGNHDIYGARVSTSGTVLDPAGLPISATTGAQANPAIAWNGNRYLVAWDDSGQSSTYDVNGARVTVNGAVEDPLGIHVSHSGTYPNTPAVAAAGDVFLVTWNAYVDDGSDAEVMGSRVGDDGTLLDAADLHISSAANVQLAPAIASNGGGYLVVWQDHRDGPSDGSAANIYGVRVSASGVVLDPGGLAIATGPGKQSTPQVASDGTGYLVVWRDGQSGGRLGAARLAGDGTTIEAFDLGVAASSLRAVTSNGTDYLVVWTESPTSAQGEVLGVVVTPGGVTSVTTIANADTPIWSAAAASDGTDYLVAWQQGDGLHDNIYAGRVLASGSVIDSSGLAVTLAGGEDALPSVAFDGSDYQIVWSSETNTQTTLSIATMTTGGSLIDPGTAIATSTPTGSAQIASAGGDTLIAWANGTEIRAAYLGGVDFHVAEAHEDFTAPAVASTGDGFLVGYVRTLRVYSRLIGHGCGDGIVDLGEACDDGNLDPGDGCDPSCRVETPVDAGAPPDAAATLDSGSGSADANRAHDASPAVPDAGVVPRDGSSPVPDASDAHAAAPDGCGCQSTGGGVDFGASLLLALVFARRRRRFS